MPFPLLAWFSRLLMRKSASFFCLGLAHFCLFIQVIGGSFGIEGHMLVRLRISGHSLELSSDLADRLRIGDLAVLYFFVSCNEHPFFDCFGRRAWRRWLNGGCWC